MKNYPKWLRPDRPWIWLVVVILGAALFLADLGGIPFIDRDEGEYSTVAREMIQRSDWVVPHVNGRVYFEKPPLFFWLMALSFKAFGFEEGAGRLPSALAGLVLAGLLGWFGRRQLGGLFGLLTVSMTITAFLIVLLARVALLDTLLTLWTTAALIFFYEGYRAPPDRERWYFLVGWIALGLAFLTKGPVGVVIPLITLIPMAIFNRDLLITLKRVRIWEGLIVGLVIVGPWLALAFLQEGRMLWNEFFIDQHLTRFTKVVLGHGAPAWFYLPILAVGLWPWFAFSLPAWWRGLFRGSRTERTGSAEANLDFFLGLWLIGSLLFFSATATKQPNYILPAVPAVIMLSARWWQEYLSGAQAKPFERWLTFGLTGLIGLVLSIFFLAVGWFLPMALEKARAKMRPDSAEYAFPLHPPDLGWGTALVGLALAAAIVTAFYFLRSRRLGATFMAFIFGALVLIAGLTHLTAPAVFDYLQTPAREIAAQAAGEAGPTDRVATFGLYKPTLWFYTGLHLERIESRDREGLRAFLDSEERRLVLSRLSLLQTLKAQERFRQLGVKGGYVLGDNKGRAP